MEFSVGDFVFVKDNPLRNVVRFRRAGKLAPRFIGPFPILDRIGKLAYRVELPARLSGVHNVFHVSHLRKYVHDPSIIIEPAQQDDLEIQPNLTILRRPIRIIDRGTKQLTIKVVNLIKVQQSDDVRDCTWETDDCIREPNPELLFW